jgi:hypothetical protein
MNDLENYFHSLMLIPKIQTLPFVKKFLPEDNLQEIIFLEKYFRDDERENVYVYQSLLFDPPSTGSSKYRISIPTYSYDH